ncbi:hypothetical protein M404DRAFT_845973 [Pisolithus tinctorius Marx 270]|uniref:Uncharacterized protein n=1 Tax=Pisolithus tinctorius Marx 270 TaxID=870435 RepID=A0A0C3NTU3_PISTI|nr:hypothetical protein M404DRAFT_845973 [Pisolithus tinctorius Marx 270]
MRQSNSIDRLASRLCQRFVGLPLPEGLDLGKHVEWNGSTNGSLHDGVCISTFCSAPKWLRYSV